MISADQPPLQIWRDRRDAIAGNWYHAVTSPQTSYIPLSPAELQQWFVALTEQVIAFLAAEPFEPASAQAIGAALADLHYLQPEALGQTQETLARQLVEGLSAAQMATLHPRLTALLGGLAAGFFRHARQTILAEQEQVRDALVTELRSVEVALREAHNLLERRVEERTAELAQANEVLRAEIAEHQRTEEALQRSHENILALLNAPLDSILIIAPEGIILAANQVTAQRVGKSVDELIGVNVYGLLPPETAAARKSHVATVMRTGRPMRFEDSRGSIYFDNTLYPVVSPQGDVIRLVIVARDITERKQAEEAIRQRNRELTTLNAIAEAVNSTLDLDEVLNRTLEHVLAATQSDMGMIALLDKAARLYPAASRGMPASLLETVPYAPPGTIERALHTPLTVLEDAPAAVPPWGQPQFRDAGLRSFCTIPLASQGKPVGVLALGLCQERALSAEALTLAHAAAQQVGVAIANARLYAELAEEKQKTEIVLQSVGDGVFTTDRDLSLLSLNPAAARMLGWEECETIGRSCSEVLQCQDARGNRLCANACPLVAAMREQRYEYSRPGMWFARSRAGQPVPIWGVTGPLVDPDGAVLGGVMAFRDASYESEMERLQHEFISMISHEVRAPLTNLKAAAQTIIRLEAGQPAEIRMDMARIIASQCDRIDRLVSRVETAAEVDAGRLDLQIVPLHLPPLVREVAQTFQIREKPCSFDVIATDESALWVMGDADRISMIVSNLLDNAVKYSRSQGAVIVKLSLWDPRRVLVSVIDEGPPIPADQRDRIFRRFYRMDNRDSRSVYGLGLGLYITQKLVTALGGQIWVEESESQGNRFCFTLPRWQERA